MPQRLFNGTAVAQSKHYPGSIPRPLRVSWVTDYVGVRQRRAARQLSIAVPSDDAPMSVLHTFTGPTRTGAVKYGRITSHDPRGTGAGPRSAMDRYKDRPCAYSRKYQDLPAPKRTLHVRWWHSGGSEGGRVRHRSSAPIGSTRIGYRGQVRSFPICRRLVCEYSFPPASKASRLPPDVECLGCRRDGPVGRCCDSLLAVWRFSSYELLSLGVTARSQT